MWPKVTNCTPAICARMAASVSATKAGIAEVGMAMSSLIFSPSWACASGMLSRTCHRLRACAKLSASTASVTSACSMAASSTSCNCCWARSAPDAAVLVTEFSSKMHQGAVSANGTRCCGKWRSTICKAVWFISSNPVKPASSRWRASASKATAASSDGNAAHATICAPGKGNSLSVAAVMMPSVPSLPISKWRRS